MVLIMIVLLINTKKNMFGSKEEELAQLGRDSKEKYSCSLDIRCLFSIDDNTKSSKEGLSHLDSGVRDGGRLIHLCKGSEYEYMYFNIDILNTIFEKKGSEANSDFNATLSRKRARFNTNPDNNRSSGFANYSDVNWVKANVLYFLFY